MPRTSLDNDAQRRRETTPSTPARRPAGRELGAPRREVSADSAEARAPMSPRRPIQLEFRREVRIHNTPPTRVLVVETGAQDQQPGFLTRSPIVEDSFSPPALPSPPPAPESPSPIMWAAREVASPLPAGALNPLADSFVPAYSPPPSRPPSYGASERSPFDLFPLAGEPASQFVQGFHPPTPPIRPIPSVSPRPIRALPRTRRDRGSRPPRAASPPLPPVSLPAIDDLQGSFYRAVPFGVERLAARADPFVRREGPLEIVPSCYIDPLDPPGRPSQTIDGYDTKLHAYALRFMHNFVFPVRTGMVVNIRTARGAPLGEVILHDELRREGGNAFIYGTRAELNCSYPAVFRLPQTYSQALTKREVFLCYEFGINPALGLEEIARRTRFPERWEHLQQNAEPYTLERILREVGREDVLVGMKPCLRGLYVGLPESQYFSTCLLFGAYGPGRFGRRYWGR